MRKKPHILMVVPRGEAIRNFVYSDTLRILNKHVRITLLSIIDDEKFLSPSKPFVEKIISLNSYNENALVLYLRSIISEAHYRWLWSEAAKKHWETRNARATTLTAKLKWNILKLLIPLFANRYCLEALTGLENNITWLLRPNSDFQDLFESLRPEIIFNCSHIHGPAAELSLKIAHFMGIPLVAFIFSWDNLTSRSRITVPYDYYLVWTEHLRNLLLSIYPFISPERVFVTGTPQFDFHFKEDFWLTRDELCRKIGAKPDRPFILYTTGIDIDFPEEHRTVELVAKILQELELLPKPQLIVRTYIKGTSREMIALAKRNLPGVIFPPTLWVEKGLFTPMYEDLAIYTSLLRHCCLGINAASTVSLELLIHDKPVINLGFDPPGSSIPHHLRWIRHINLEHYRPVAESGAVMVARNPNDMRRMLIRGLTEPQADSEKRKNLIKEMFGNMLDGNSGRRIAEVIVKLAKSRITD